MRKSFEQTARLSSDILEGIKDAVFESSETKQAKRRESLPLSAGGMQSFDVAEAAGDQAPLGGDVPNKKRRSTVEQVLGTKKEEQRSSLLKIILGFLCWMLMSKVFGCWPFEPHPHTAGEHHEQPDELSENHAAEEAAAEEALLEAWQQAMQQAAAQQAAEPQYRLIPTDMIPGLPPGGWVRVRVAGAASHADGAGDHGNTGAGGMERDDKPDMLSVKAHLPGHHMLEEKSTFDAHENLHEYDDTKKEANPLDVKLIERTLLIRGTTREPMPHMGDGVFMQSSFQRAIWLPANALADKIHAEYRRKSGNLIIEIPKDPTKPERDDLDEDHPVEDAQRMEKIRASFEDFQRRVRAMQSQNREGVRGPGQVRGVNYNDLKSRLETMHKEGDGPLLEDKAPHAAAISRDHVEYLGCFRSWDLPMKKKQLPAHAASSFASVVVAAVQDAQDEETEEGDEDQYFFAMARHDAPHKTGAAFTFKQFDHEIDNQHGVMCGNHCEDDGTWFCGALGDVEHHSENAVEDGVSGALFAAYALRKPKEISHKALEAAAAADAAAEVSDHPQWKLVDDFNGGESKVEIIVPKASESLTHDGKTAIFTDSWGAETTKVVVPMKLKVNDCEFGEPHGESQDRVVTCLVGDGVFQPIRVVVKDEL